MLIGLTLVVLLVLLTGAIGVPYSAHGEVQTAFLFNKEFWAARLYASAAWTFGDSGATNITALGTAVVAVLASGTTLASVFPAIDLNPFIIMNIACGAIVAAAPLLFGIANVVISRRSPVAPADAMLTLRANATVMVPSGASISVSGGAVIRTANRQEKAVVKPGGTVPVPPGSTITIGPGAFVGLPNGNALAIGPAATVTVDTGTWIAAQDLGPARSNPMGGQSPTFRRPGGAPPAPDPHIRAGDLIMVAAGATANITGAADIRFRAGTTITAVHGRGMRLKADTTITVPSSSNVMVAGMASMLPTAALTMFGIGTEIGLVTVLAVHYSRATHLGQIAAGVISAAVTAGLALYGATAIRALADPTPGSSLNAGAASSFTL